MRVALRVYFKSLLRVYYTLIMGRLIIYCEYIMGFINVFFVVNFCDLTILFFKKRTFVLVLIFSTTFSPFNVLDTTNVL
jgi:hypothetical protein